MGCDGVVLQAHISKKENQLLVVISLLEYLAYKEFSCFGGLARVRWNIFYSISESPIQVEVTGRGVPKSRVYPSFGYETQQPRERLDGRFIQLMSFGWWWGV